MNANKNQQIIDFNDYDENCPTFINKRNLIVRPSAQSKDIDSKASNKITTQNVVDYSWEDRYTLGGLISYHSHSKLVAYVLSISGNYMIRVLSEETSARCLIKEFSGEITDVSFSRGKEPYVACIDVSGAVKITKVLLTEDIIECQLILHIKASPFDISLSPKVSYSRVMWCNHSDINESQDEETDSSGTNISLLLGIAHGATFEVLQVDTIESELINRSELYDAKVDRNDLRLIATGFQEQYAMSESLSELFLPYLSYTATGDNTWITSIAISSDAAAFAVGLQDGSVHFFTLDGSSPLGLKEAYSWQPFDGDVVWSLLFLDDCRPNSCTDSFWCHVVVGGAFNRQLKLFRCDKWNCVQTITFQAPALPCLMSAHLDESAMFLILSDIRRKALYMLEIDSIDGGVTKLFKSVQEFVLTQPLLSFDINSITSTLNTDGGHQVVLKLFTITKSAFQKMKVTYISKGHKLNEVMMDGEDEEEVIFGLGGHQSVLTQISSLPSAASSFQDPAIISTQIHNDFPLLLNKQTPSTLSKDVPVSLQHLFSNAVTMSKDLPNINHDRLHDSGDESEDETSMDDIAKFDDKRKSSDKFKEEDRGFPFPPSVTNGSWKSGQDHYPSFNGEEYRTSGNDKEIKNNVCEDKVISRMETIFESQRRDMEMMMINIREMKEQLKSKTNGEREIRQMWGERTVKEVNDGCQKVLSAQLGPCVRDVVDTFIPRIVGDIGGRLGEEVRNRMKAVEPVMRDFTNDLLHDKKFIGYLSGVMADSLEKPLKAMYTDMVRRELVPALTRTMDKMLADIRDMFKENVKEVMKNVEENNKLVLRTLGEKIVLSSTAESQKSLEMESLMKKIMTEVTASRVAMNETLNEQNIKITELLKTVKEMSATDTSGALRLSKGSSHMNVSTSLDNMAIREQRINKLMSSGDFAEALNEALSLTNLRVLLNVCARIKPKTVLSGSAQKPSGLHSSSILALIQQLSRDFQDHSDIKIEFLFDALLSLDIEDVNIRDHVSKILKGVARRLQIHMDQDCAVNKDKVAMLLRLVTSRFEISQE